MCLNVHALRWRMEGGSGSCVNDHRKIPPITDPIYQNTLWANWSESTGCLVNTKSQRRNPLLWLNNNTTDALKKLNLAGNGLMERVRRLHVKIACSRQCRPVSIQFRLINCQMCSSSHVTPLWPKLWATMFKTFLLVSFLVFALLLLLFYCRIGLVRFQDHVDVVSIRSHCDLEVWKRFHQASAGSINRI